VPEQYQKADVRPNAVYAALMKSLKSDAEKGSDEERKHQAMSIKKLIASEEEWIRYRDLHCDAAKYEFEGGSMAPMIWSSSMEQVTNDRIQGIRNAHEAGDRKF
jgi:uncharacterized protein YecT (DUF1311 family)